MTAHTLVIDTEDRRARCMQVIARLPLPTQVTIEEYSARRTVDQNARLWKLHSLASQVTGYSVDELHEMCKKKFLPHRTVKVGTEEFDVPCGSSRLGKKDFGDFMTQVEEFYISNLGVWLGD